MAADSTNPEATTPAVAEKKPPIMIILIVAIVLSVGASLVVAKMMFGGKAGAAPKAEKVEVGVSMALDEFLVNLADTNADRYLKTTISLGLKKGLTEDDLKDKVPQIRDCINMVLMNQHLDDIRTEAGKDKLKKTLVDKINAKIADDKEKTKVVDIYFQGFATQ